MLPSTPRALGSLGWFRGAPRGLAAPPGRLLPGPGCRGGLRKGRSMRIQGGQSGESLQSAPILSNCARGAASIGDLLARNSLLPDLRPGADSRGASVRPCQGALAPRLPPRSPPFPQEGGHRGTLKPPPKPQGRGCLKSGVQPIVNLPSPYSFSSVPPPPRPPRIHPALPSRTRAGKCTLHGTREGVAQPGYECRLPAGTWVPDAERARGGWASRVKAVGSLETRGPRDCQFRSWTELGPVAGGGGVGGGDEGAERRRKPPPPNPGQRGQSQFRRRLGCGGACVPVSSASSPVVNLNGRWVLKCC